jgi:hypothetical protein
MTNIINTFPTTTASAVNKNIQSKNVAMFGFSDVDAALIRDAIMEKGSVNGLSVISSATDLPHAFIINAATDAGKHEVARVRRFGIQRLIIAVDLPSSLKTLNISASDSCLVLQFPLSHWSVQYCLTVLGQRIASLEPVHPSSQEIPSAPTSIGVTGNSTQSNASQRFKLKRFPPVALLSINPSFIRVSSFLLTTPRSIDELSTISGVRHSHIKDFIQLCEGSNLIDKELINGTSTTSKILPLPKPAPMGFLNKLRMKLGII